MTGVYKTRSPKGNLPPSPLGAHSTARWLRGGLCVCVLGSPTAQVLPCEDMETAQLSAPVRQSQMDTLSQGQLLRKPGSWSWALGAHPQGL